MCGIAGWIDLKNVILPQKHILDLMSQTLTNRGPDSNGTWESYHALIAHRRLAVVDPAGGLQPMIRERGGYQFVITYNGELYNTSELRSELELLGNRFTSNSDTEVLLVSYMQWGSSCVEKLNGIYAFAIWDDKNQSLFLARDRFGVKPLFYALKGSSVIFGSELKTLLAHPDVEPVVSSEGLAEIFALGPSRTPGHGIYKDVYEVKPSHCLLVNSSGLHMHKYWSLQSHEHDDSTMDTIDYLSSLIKDSIERQLVADVPVCTFLSGGLDSSAITAYAAKWFQSQMNMPLDTYSIDYKDNEKYFKESLFQPNSDAPWVKKMSEEFKTNHHYVWFDTPNLIEALEGAVEARDLPGMADIDSSLWLFCKEIKKNATVGLSGECADEVFGGYPWFHKEDLLFTDTFPWAKSMDQRTKIYSKEFTDLINPQEYIDFRYRETLKEVPRLEGESSLEARRREMFYLNITWFMSTLLDRKDRMSMAHGLEVRVPYCDHRLVQYVWNIPWELKMFKSREKGLLREALSGVLPYDVLWRKKSPYPKTHNPSYEKAVKERVLEIIGNKNSPILPLIDEKVVRLMAEGKSDYGKPWFGQLMAGPQLFAYIIQADMWLRKYKVQIK